MMGPWGWHGWGPGIWAMGALWLLVIGAIVLLVMLLVRGLGNDRTGTHPTSSPPAPPGVTGRGAAQTILDERLARGEIGVQEYTERSRALGDG